MMEEELAARVGVKHAKVADRRANRHGSAPGSVCNSAGLNSAGTRSAHRVGPTSPTPASFWLHDHVSG